MNFRGRNIDRRIYLFVALAMSLVMVLGACSSSNTPTATNTPGPQGPIKIGISLPLTGDFSADGKPTEQGYQLWQEEVNKHGGLLGRQVQLDIVNDNSNDNQATTAYQKFISTNHDDLILGPFGFQSSPAAIIANRYHYAFINGTGVYGKFFQLGLHNVFSVSLPTDSYFSSFANYILSLPAGSRPKTVAYATGDDPFTKPQVDLAKKQLDNGGVTSVYFHPYPDETTDFAPIAQGIIQSGADAVVLGTLGLPDCLAFMKAFKQQHYNPKVIIASAGPDQGDAFSKPLGLNATEGIFVPNAGWWPQAKNFQNDTFVQNFTAKFGVTADNISSDSVQAYSVGQVLEQAVNKIHSIDNAALIQELHKDTFNTLQGPVKFDDIGRNTIGEAYLFQWQKGTLIPVYPANQAVQNPEYPRPNWP